MTLFRKQQLIKQYMNQSKQNSKFYKQIAKADQHFQRLELRRAADTYGEIIEANPQSPSNGIGNRTHLFLTASLPLSNWYASQKREKVLAHSAYDGLYLSCLIMGELQTLRNWLTDLLEKHPKCPQISLSLGHIHYHFERYEQAEVFYRRALKLDRGWEKPYECMALLSLVGKKDCKAAAKWAKEGLNANSDNKVCKLLALVLSSEFGEYHSTFPYLQKAYKIVACKHDDTLALIYQNIGYLYKARKENEKSIEMFQESHKIDPKQSKYPRIIGQIYNNMLNDSQMAINWMNKAVNINLPVNFDLLYSMATCAFNRYNFYEAERYLLKYTTFHEDDRFDVKGILFLGSIQEKLNKYFQAEKTLKLYLKKADKDQLHHGYSSLGNLYSKLRKYDQAILSYLEGNKMDSSLVHIYLKLGKTYFYKKQFDQSIQWLEKGLLINPKQQHIITALGCTYAKIKNYDEALKYFHRSIEVCPQYYRPYYEIGSFYFKLEDYSTAIEWYRKALIYKPIFPQCFYDIAKCYEATANFEETNKSLENLQLILAKDNHLSQGYKRKILIFINSFYERSEQWVDKKIRGVYGGYSKLKIIHLSRQYEEVFKRLLN